MLYYFWLSIMMLNSPLPRCWVGVVDQINPPWVIVLGEQGEKAHVSVEQTYHNIKEGDWVIYWSRTHRLEHIDSMHSRDETAEQERLLQSLFSLP